MADPLEALAKGSMASGGSTEEDAARDVLSAIKTGDPKSLSLALKRHYEACQDSDYEVDEDDKED